MVFKMANAKEPPQSPRCSQMYPKRLLCPTLQTKLYIAMAMPLPIKRYPKPKLIMLVRGLKALYNSCPPTPTTGQ